MKYCLAGILPQRRLRCMWTAKHQTGAPGTISFWKPIILTKAMSLESICQAKNEELQGFQIEGLDRPVEEVLMMGLVGRWRYWRIGWRNGMGWMRRWRSGRRVMDEKWKRRIWRGVQGVKRRCGIVKLEEVCQSWRIDERWEVFCKLETLERQGHQQAAVAAGEIKSTLKTSSGFYF